MRPGEQPARPDIRAPEETSADGDRPATLAVANTGNHPLRLQFDAVDHDHGLAVRVDPWELPVEPFSERTLHLVVPFGNCPERERHAHRLELASILLLVPGLVTDLVGALLLPPGIARVARARVPGKPGRAVGDRTEGGDSG